MGNPQVRAEPPGGRLTAARRLLQYILLLGAACSAMAAAEPRALRFGVLSIAPPARIYANWQPFANHLAEQLQQQVDIIVPRGFGKMKNAVVNGEVDIFYVNSYVFYRLKQEGKAVGIAQMQNIDGTTTSRSEIYVRADSGIEDVKALKGRSIAFVSPMGAGGYLAPRAYLYANGLHTGDDSSEIFTKNLSNSIHKVLLRELDAGTMCGVNYRLMSQKVETGELRIIGVSDAYPENVIAARADLDPERAKRIADVILGMSETDAGGRILADMRSMKIERFTAYDPDSESVTTKLLEQAQLKP
jgi:phosphonate transport system substrate-binding protein